MSKQLVNTIKRSTSLLRARRFLSTYKPQSIIVRPLQTQSTSTIPNIPFTSKITSNASMPIPFKKVKSSRI